MISPRHHPQTDSIDVKFKFNFQVADDVNVIYSNSWKSRNLYTPRVGDIPV